MGWDPDDGPKSLYSTTPEVHTGVVAHSRGSGPPHFKEAGCQMFEHYNYTKTRSSQKMLSLTGSEFLHYKAIHTIADIFVIYQCLWKWSTNTLYVGWHWKIQIIKPHKDIIIFQWWWTSYFLYSSYVNIFKTVGEIIQYFTIYAHDLWFLLI